MSSSGQSRDTAEPLVDTYILNILADADRPLQGEPRDRIMKRIRDNVRNRRTINGVAERVAMNITSPAVDAIRREGEDMIKETVKDTLENRTSQGN